MFCGMHTKPEIILKDFVCHTETMELPYKQQNVLLLEVHTYVAGRSYKKVMVIIMSYIDKHNKRNNP